MSVELLGTYAVLLKIVRKNSDAAEAMYRQAIVADPHWRGG